MHNNNDLHIKTIYIINNPNKQFLQNQLSVKSSSSALFV